MWAETRRQAAQSGFLSCSGPPPQALVQLPTVPTTRVTEALTPVFSPACKKVSLSYQTVLGLLEAPQLCNAIHPQTASTSPQRPSGSYHLRATLTTGISHALHWTLTKTWSQAHAAPLTKNIIPWHSPLGSNLAGRA